MLRPTLLRQARTAYRSLPKPARHFLREVTTGRPFVTLSPHLPIAIHGAFQRMSERERDPFAGGAYYEFGVYRGYSLWFAEQISREYAGADFTCLGFDSFLGLPASAVDGSFYDTGDFAAGHDEVVANLRAHGADFGRLRLFQGFYGRELFEDLARDYDFPPAAICTIDVDVYESCLEVLRFLHGRLRVGSIIIFDDYNDMGASDEHGERRALETFRRAHPTFSLRHLRDVGPEAAVFEVTAI
ncbi:TylF/MycF/NovP-related O-methyltransferase [Nonomuraea sp. NPDC050404]|uniref:TylF/MycF/NovP-related O-methyltransferase n=1 Tax=Nonomuraea sp. NPDC050404 TaxID=3155783 RepID=UPI0033F9ACD2